ncbi:hypothetical protein C7999DRAFT_17743 [Corynascus novoguineensis]|uniref:Uncharacterized protein n=1 Tax=Corynascus novoguineensis TaxID=1126955 RepID=A0AAN7CNG1_9PEZI|nr:hypothetical protein C7999DRAFT_17743 [Corynascus novoguineensis]
MTSPPSPGGQNTSGFASPPPAPRRAPRPGTSQPGPSHSHSNSVDSNHSNGSMASSSTAPSTQPLNPPQRQNTGFSKFSPGQNKVDQRDKGTSGAGAGGGYSGSGDKSGAARTPYMNMLLSLDRIPRMHNILVTFFMWILLVGFVIIPGSFTSDKRKQDGATVELPLGGGGGGGGGANGGSGGGSSSSSSKKLSLTPANTAALVIGFVCVLTGAFGSAWLALRWRRNYVWLLNKLYLPLILTALAGLLATITSVYTQQAGDWGPQAIVTAVVEAVILGLSIILFFVYNYWLLQRVRSEHEEDDNKWSRKEKKRRRRNERKERRRGGLLARFRRARNKPPIGAGGVV